MREVEHVAASTMQRRLPARSPHRDRNGPKVTQPALPFRGRRRKERPFDGSSDGGRDIEGSVARALVEGDDLLRELTRYWRASMSAFAAWRSTVSTPSVNRS